MSRGTPDPASPARLSRTGLSPSLAGLPRTVLLGSLSILQSLPRNARAPVWALPPSLAATYGITFVFFSSGYLDVSVHRVPPVHLLQALASCLVYGDGGFLRRVSPFRYLRVYGYLLLAAAFRSLSRLSSALSA